MSNKLVDRLNNGPVICTEGFLFEIERRGYMASGEFVPMVSLDHPEVLENLHREFQHAGSDVVEAFTYNGHREKMRVIGKEELLEPLNRSALKIAKKVAMNTPAGMAIPAGVFIATFFAIFKADLFSGSNNSSLPITRIFSR